MDDYSKQSRQFNISTAKKPGIAARGDAPLHLCLGLFLISGAAALIYQVVWIRLLGLSMGTTSAAVSCVVAAFFLGLALGSYAAGRLAKDKVDLFKLYLTLEIVIAVSGLFVLVALLNLDKIMSVLPFWGTHLLAKFTLTVAILLVPTVCMGATFPILALACLRAQPKGASSFGQLYAYNTAGAVVGVLSSGFILIPHLGLTQATYVACALNVLAGFIAMMIRSKYEEIIPTVKLIVPTTENSQIVSNTNWIAVITLFTMGFVSLGLQISWTQYLSIFMGGTIYGFSAILSVFLIGISAGAWALHRVSNSLVLDKTTYVYGLVLLAGTLIFTRSGLTLVPDIAYSLKALQYQYFVYPSAKYAIILVILFIPTFLMGGLFPIAMSIYSSGSTTERNEFGTGYAINTVGGIVGVVLVGLWFIPSRGTDNTIVILILTTTILAGLMATTLPRKLDKVVSGIAVLVLIWQCISFSGLNYQNMIMANPYRFDSSGQSGKLPKFLYLKEGKSSVISVITYDNVIAHLQSNGIQESYISISGNQPPPKAETLLGMLPYLLHHDPKSAFVIGFGGGHTTNALTSTALNLIRVAELENAVIEAVENIGNHATNTLRDDKVDLLINDARNTLLVNQSSYDLIVSQPSHPWLAGAGNLFTKEFFEIVSNRLNKGGIFAQWINLFNMDTTTLLSILKAYYKVFPFGFTVALTDSGDLLVLGSNSTIIFDVEDINQSLKSDQISDTLGHWNINTAESITSLFTLSRNQILESSSHIEMNTDDRVFSEVRLANLRKDPTGQHSPYTWIKNTANRDMEGYFKTKDLAQALYSLGLLFKNNDQLEELEFIYNRLAPLDHKLFKMLKDSTS